MSLQQYAQMVKEDLKINLADLDREETRTAPLHSKYLLLYLDETKKLETMKRVFSILRHEKRLYYLGKADPEVYKEKPFDLLVKPIKSEVDEYIDTDPEIQAAEAEISEQEHIVKYLNDMIKQINQRGFEIKGAIDWIKFKSGLNN
jgi:hypothetical protein